MYIWHLCMVRSSAFCCHMSYTQIRGEFSYWRHKELLNICITYKVVWRQMQIIYLWYLRTCNLHYKPNSMWHETYFHHMVPLFVSVAVFHNVSNSQYLPHSLVTNSNNSKRTPYYFFNQSVALWTCVLN